VSRKPSTQSSDSAGGVKIQVKKKRSVKAPITSVQDDVAVLKAKEALEALEAGREADEKLLAQDAKRQEMTRLQKEEAEDLKKQQEQAKQQTENTKKTGDANSDDKSKKPKRLRNTSGTDGRKQLHVAKKNPSRKLKKKDRTRLSQKIQEEQAQHGFQKPIEKVVHEVSIPDNIKVSDLAQKMATKAGEVLKVLMGMGVMATLNDVIDQDTALLVVEEMGHTGVVNKGQD
jgi:translation initiation factor IF-2